MPSEVSEWAESLENSLERADDPANGKGGVGVFTGQRRRQGGPGGSGQQQQKLTEMTPCISDYQEKGGFSTSGDQTGPAVHGEFSHNASKEGRDGGLPESRERAQLITRIPFQLEAQKESAGRGANSQQKLRDGSVKATTIHIQGQQHVIQEQPGCLNWGSSNSNQEPKGENTLDDVSLTRHMLAIKGQRSTGTIYEEEKELLDNRSDLNDPQKAEDLRQQPSLKSSQRSQNGYNKPRGEGEGERKRSPQLDPRPDDGRPSRVRSPDLSGSPVAQGPVAIDGMPITNEGQHRPISTTGQDPTARSGAAGAAGTQGPQDEVLAFLRMMALAKAGDREGSNDGFHTFNDQGWNAQMPLHNKLPERIIISTCQVGDEGPDQDRYAAGGLTPLFGTHLGQPSDSLIGRGDRSFERSELGRYNYVHQNCNMPTYMRRPGSAADDKGQRTARLESNQQVVEFNLRRYARRVEKSVAMKPIDLRRTWGAHHAWNRQFRRQLEELRHFPAGQGGAATNLPKVLKSQEQRAKPKKKAAQDQKNLKRLNAQALMSPTQPAALGSGGALTLLEEFVKGGGPPEETTIYVIAKDAGASHCEEFDETRLEGSGAPSTVDGAGVAKSRGISPASAEREKTPAKDFKARTRPSPGPPIKVSVGVYQSERLDSLGPVSALTGPEAKAQDQRKQVSSLLTGYPDNGRDAIAGFGQGRKTKVLVDGNGHLQEGPKSVRGPKSHKRGRSPSGRKQRTPLDSYVPKGGQTRRKIVKLGAVKGDESPGLSLQARRAAEMNVQGQGYSSGLARRRDEIDQGQGKVSNPGSRLDGPQAQRVAKNVKHLEVGNIMKTRDPEAKLRSTDPARHGSAEAHTGAEKNVNDIRHEAAEHERRRKDSEQPEIPPIRRPAQMQMSDRDGSLEMRGSRDDTHENGGPQTKSNFTPTASRGSVGRGGNTARERQQIHYLDQEMHEKGRGRGSPIMRARGSDLGARDAQSQRSSLEETNLRDKSIAGESQEERQARMYTITEDSRATAPLRSQGHHPGYRGTNGQELGESELKTENADLIADQLHLGLSGVQRDLEHQGPSTGRDGAPSESLAPTQLQAVNASRNTDSPSGNNKGGSQIITKSKIQRELPRKQKASLKTREITAEVHLLTHPEQRAPGATPGRTAFSSEKTDFRDATGRIWPSRLDSTELAAEPNERAPHNKYQRQRCRSKQTDKQAPAIFCNRIFVNKMQRQENTDRTGSTAGPNDLDSTQEGHHGGPDQAQGGSKEDDKSLSPRGFEDGIEGLTGAKMSPLDIQKGSNIINGSTPSPQPRHSGKQGPIGNDSQNWFQLSSLHGKQLRISQGGSPHFHAAKNKYDEGDHSSKKSPRRQYRNFLPGTNILHHNQQRGRESNQAQGANPSMRITSPKHHDMNTDENSGLPKIFAQTLNPQSQRSQSKTKQHQKKADSQIFVCLDNMQFGTPPYNLADHPPEHDSIINKQANKVQTGSPKTSMHVARRSSVGGSPNASAGFGGSASSATYQVSPQQSRRKTAFGLYDTSKNAEYSTLYPSQHKGADADFFQSNQERKTKNELRKSLKLKKIAGGPASVMSDNESNPLIITEYNPQSISRWDDKAPGAALMSGPQKLPPVNQIGIDDTAFKTKGRGASSGNRRNNQLYFSVQVQPKTQASPFLSNDVQDLKSDLLIQDILRKSVNLTASPHIPKNFPGRMISNNRTGAIPKPINDRSPTSWKRNGQELNQEEQPLENYATTRGQDEKKNAKCQVITKHNFKTKEMYREVMNSKPNFFLLDEDFWEDDCNVRLEGRFGRQDTQQTATQYNNVVAQNNNQTLDSIDRTNIIRQIATQNRDLEHLRPPKTSTFQKARGYNLMPQQEQIIGQVNELQRFQPALSRHLNTPLATKMDQQRSLNLASAQAVSGLAKQPDTTLFLKSLLQRQRKGDQKLPQSIYQQIREHAHRQVTLDAHSNRAAHKNTFNEDLDPKSMQSWRVQKGKSSALKQHDQPAAAVKPPQQQEIQNQQRRFNILLAPNAPEPQPPIQASQPEQTRVPITAFVSFQDYSAGNRSTQSRQSHQNNPTPPVSVQDSQKS